MNQNPQTVISKFNNYSNSFYFREDLELIQPPKIASGFLRIAQIFQIRDG
jgi:hypothetical protein